MNNLRFVKIFLHVFLSATLLLTGCGFVNHKPSASDGAVSVPDTSTLRNRQKFLDESLSEPRELKPGEIAITIRIRPQFVLHLNKKLKVVSFEALNDDAIKLKHETHKKWKRTPYKKAVRRILDQAVIDGYISDVSPVIDIQISESQMPLDEADSVPFAGNDGSASADDPQNTATPGSSTITFVDLRTIEDNVLTVAEDVAAIHGITAEVTLHEDSE